MCYTGICPHEGTYEQGTCDLANDPQKHEEWKKKCPSCNKEVRNKL